MRRTDSITSQRNSLKSTLVFLALFTASMFYCNWLSDIYTTCKFLKFFSNDMIKVRAESSLWFLNFPNLVKRRNYQEINTVLANKWVSESYIAWLISSQCTLSLPLENIRKHYGFQMISGGRERVHWERMA